MSDVAQLKQHKREIIAKYAQRSTRAGYLQIINTLVPYTLLFWLALETFQSQLWLSALAMAAMILFLVRIFMLMHDCGHESLFPNSKLNKFWGFICGVLVGMPQYVWAVHHNFHHSTNGNWSKYRGPLATLSTSEYSELSPKQQKRYAFSRNILFAPLGGFMYFIFSPRVNWLVGSIKCLMHILTEKVKSPSKAITVIAAEFEDGPWQDKRQYLHMTGNNIVLISSWIALSSIYGAAAFFAVYLITLSLAGGLGIIIFTIQHNFEDSYAADSEHWDYDSAALLGTSYLTFPRWLNWFSADIAYHHIHHLSAKIPNYRLEAAHKEYAHLFGRVKTISVNDVSHAFKYILWDEKQQKIISVAQYQEQSSAQHATA